MELFSQYQISALYNMGASISECCNNISEQGEVQVTNTIQAPCFVGFNEMPTEVIHTICRAIQHPCFKKIKLSYASQKTSIEMFNIHLSQIQFPIQLKRFQQNFNGSQIHSGSYIYVKSKCLLNPNPEQRNLQLQGYYAILYLPKLRYFYGYFKGRQAINGVFVFSPSIYYVGDIVNSHAHGYGVFNRNNEYVYQGNWQNSLAHKKGKEKYENGDVYEGDFLYGSKLGKGLYRFKDGRIYTGNFYNGQSDGYGELVGKDYEYKGEWKLGMMDGKGVQKWAMGDSYSGEFKKGIREGRGVYTFQGGITYEGQWEQGLLHGTVEVKEGFDRISTHWQKGVRIG